MRDGGVSGTRAAGLVCLLLCLVTLAGAFLAGPRGFRVLAALTLTGLAVWIGLLYRAISFRVASGNKAVRESLSELANRQREMRDDQALTQLHDAAARHEKALTGLHSAVQKIEDQAALASASLLPGPKSVRERPEVLFVSSNGAGLGHLTRLMAIAERLDAEAEFLTMSSGHRLVAHRGHRVSYFPSYGTLGMETPSWTRYFAGYIRRFIAERRPDMVVFDGTWVYPGLTEACRLSGTPLVWVQRGCWKGRKDKSSTQRHNAARVCDAVILPGDYGCVEDVDLGSRIDVCKVSPITLVSREQLLGRDEARQTLGLRPDLRYVLVQLGAGNINDTTSLLDTAVTAVTGLGPQWVPVVVRSPIAEVERGVDGAVTVASYPVAQHFAAFEFAVGASGYNFVQECVGLGLPSVLVPNLAARTDAQRRRAQGVVDLKVASMAAGVDDLPAAIRATAECLPAMTRALEDVARPTGAAEAAKFLIEQLGKNRFLGQHANS